MHNLFLFLLPLSSAVLTAQQTYAGAMALGSFRIDRDISLESLFDRLGRPSLESVGGMFSAINRKMVRHFSPSPGWLPLMNRSLLAL
jgi:hypothetical protein